MWERRHRGGTRTPARDPAGGEQAGARRAPVGRCQTERTQLTPIWTQSSPWNLGMYLSPRASSELLSGRKRHTTLMQVSAASAMSRWWDGARARARAGAQVLAEVPGASRGYRCCGASLPKVPQLQPADSNVAVGGTRESRGRSGEPLEDEVGQSTTPVRLQLRGGRGSGVTWAAHPGVAHRTSSGKSSVHRNLGFRVRMGRDSSRKLRGAEGCRFESRGRQNRGDARSPSGTAGVPLSKEPRLQMPIEGPAMSWQPEASRRTSGFISQLIFGRAPDPPGPDRTRTGPVAPSRPDNKCVWKHL